MNKTNCRKCGKSAIEKRYKLYPYHTVWFCDCGYRNVIMVKNIGSVEYENQRDAF